MEWLLFHIIVNILILFSIYFNEDTAEFFFPHHSLLIVFLTVSNTVCKKLSVLLEVNSDWMHFAWKQ